MAKALNAAVQIDCEFEDEEWVDFVESATDATPAHQIVWRNLISDIFCYEPAYRVVRRDGQICGALPAFVVPSALLGRHIISVPFLNSGGICAIDEQCRTALIDESKRMLSAHRARYFEMRCAYPPPNEMPAKTHKVRIILDLPKSSDALWASLRSEIRNRIRRAEKEGLTVEFGSKDINGFYRVFAENMRELGVPAHPRVFFENVLGLLRVNSREPYVEKNRSASATAELVVVKDGSNIIGGAILIYFRDTVEVPWVSCSRSHFDKCPNNLLYWVILRRACELGLRIFDFGRSSPSTGPAVFKMRWGARAEQLYWHYVLPNGASLPGETSSANPKFQLASAVWKHAPRCFTDFVGPRIIGHLPG